MRWRADRSATGVLRSGGHRHRTWLTAAELAVAVGEELGRPDPTLALRLLALALTGFGHLEDGDEVAAFLAPNGSAAVQDRIRRAAPGAARP